MPLYHYRASDPGGNVIQGTLEAREERLVVLHLQQGGLIPLRISQEEEASRLEGAAAPAARAGCPPRKWCTSPRNWRPS